MEIKFRVWSPVTKKMYMEGLVLSGEKYFLQNEGQLEEILDAKPMLFTNCKDVSDTEIFESDIVDYPLYDHDPYYARVRGIVKNINGKWVITEPNSTSKHFPMSVNLTEQKYTSVEGNLYENPKLLR